MNRKTSAKLLEDQLGLLVRHFGPKSVWTALGKVAPESDGLPSTGSTDRPPEKSAVTTVRSVLENLKTTDSERFMVLEEFRDKLRGRRVLPDAEDLRQFAQLVGLKDLKARSRDDFISKIILLLASVSRENLSDTIARANGISAANRNEGFSVLTDKLMRGT